MHYKIFIHCDGKFFCNLLINYLDDIRLCRRIVRDVKERGREVNL